MLFWGQSKVGCVPSPEVWAGKGELRPGNPGQTVKWEVKHLNETWCEEELGSVVSKVLKVQAYFMLHQFTTSDLFDLSRQPPGIVRCVADSHQVLARLLVHFGRQQQQLARA